MAHAAAASPAVLPGRRPPPTPTASSSRSDQQGVQFTGELAGHEAAITEAHFPLEAEPHLLYTCSRDGTARGWDVRSGQQVEG